MKETLKSRFAYYLGDIIYGANDGIITTFAVVSSAAGAGFTAPVVIILGIANLIADGFSMGASRYLSLTSEQSLAGETEADTRSAFADGFATFMSFVIVGAFPLLPFLLASTAEQVFWISAARLPSHYSLLAPRARSSPRAATSYLASKCSSWEASPPHLRMASAP